MSCPIFSRSAQLRRNPALKSQLTDEFHFLMSTTAARPFAIAILLHGEGYRMRLGMIHTPLSWCVC